MAPAVNHEAAVALSLIERADLPYPLGQLLSAFVTEALDPRLAAAYIERNCPSNDNISEDLTNLALGWRFIVESISVNGVPPPAPGAQVAAEITKRDGERCCITGKAGNRKDPLIIAPILPVPSGWIGDNRHPRMDDMLGAFFTPSYRDWWLNYVRDPNSMKFHHNHWLVLKSAAEAFANGDIRLIRRRPSMIEYQVEHLSIGVVYRFLDLEGSFPLLGDHSRRGISTVDPRFVGSQARFAPTIRWLGILKRIEKNSRSQHRLSSTRSAKGIDQTRPRVFSPCKSVQKACLFAWRSLPALLRVAVYKVLQRVGRIFYGYDHSTVQELPFGLYLKQHADSSMAQNEFNALCMIRRSLFSCGPLLSDQDLANLAVQMQNVVAQLRSIPKTVNPGFAICNTSGGACQDHRIRWADPVGPFADEAAFNQMLRYPNDPGREGHRMFFTHADLNFRNILVDEVTREDGDVEWALTGIVDWETAGYYPEYWEYTKMLFEDFRYTERERRMIHAIFKPFGDYTREADVERRSKATGDHC